MHPERILLPEVTALLAKEETHQKLPLSSLENVPPFIREKAERIAEITGTWNPVEIYTADAESITKAKAELFEHFDRGEHYTPELTYSTAEKMDVTEARTELQAMLDDVRSTHYDRDDRVARLARVALIAKLQDDLASCDLVDGINNRDEPTIKRAVGRKYMGSDAELSKIVHETYEGLTHVEEKSTGSGKYSLEDMKLLTEKEFNAEEIKAAFEWGLDQLGILGEGGFKVVIDPRVTSIDVRDKSANGPTVFIPPPRKVTGRYLLELLNHEIGSHCRQSMNGARLFQIGGGALKLDEETLYEGLAMREENELTTDYFGEAEVYALPYYALAIEQAEQGKTFYEIFSHMYEIRLHAATFLALPGGPDV